MRAERIVGIVLFSIVTLLALMFMFLPFSTASIESGGTVVSEDYGLFSKLREAAPETAPDEPTSSQRWYWIDPGLDETGGITLLRAAGPIFVVGFVAGIVALVFTAIPRFSPTRIGGYIALGASGAMLLGVALTFIGAQWHMYPSLGNSLFVDYHYGVGVMTVFMLILVLVATGMGLVRPTTRVVEHVHETVEAVEEDPFLDEPFGEDEMTTEAPLVAESADTIRLQCPDCSTIVEVARGASPTCPECGFQKSSGAAQTGTAAGTGTST